jgi:hypothetical protein
MENGEKFEIDFKDLKICVTSHIINNNEVFRIVFSDGRPDLILHEGLTGGEPFWTSIPQAKHRLKEVEFFGPRIAAYFKK